jgi:hypothetical protein
MQSLQLGHGSKQSAHYLFLSRTVCPTSSQSGQQKLWLEAMSPCNQTHSFSPVPGAQNCDDYSHMLQYHTREHIMVILNQL